MIGWWVTWVGLTTLSATLLAGLLLPATRTGSHEAVLPADPERVRQTILDVEAQPRWRREVAAVELGADGRSWVEKTHAGERIRFEIREHAENRLVLRFDSSRGYRGQWLGEWQHAPGGETRLRVLESATVDHPLMRLVARVAFDPAEFARRWTRELESELARRAAAG